MDVKCLIAILIISIIVLYILLTNSSILGISFVDYIALKFKNIFVNM
jgi:hypothetical protein